MNSRINSPNTLFFIYLDMTTIKNEVQELQLYFSPFGYLDLQRACEIGDQLELREGDIFELIDDFKENCGMENYKNIDPVYIVLEHILQMARNHIEEVTGYDFINDFSRN